MKTLRYTPAGGDMGAPHLITVGDDVAESLLVNERFTLAEDPQPAEEPQEAPQEVPPESDTAQETDPLPEPAPPTPEQLARES